MYNFRKIPASNIEFIKTRNLNIEILNKFREYLKLKTLYSGNTKDGKSGTADSYCNYIIRILTIINEQRINQYNLHNIEFYNDIKSLLHDQDFKLYNLEEGRFPVNSVKSFIQFMNTEYLNDDEKIDSSESLENLEISDIERRYPQQNSQELFIQEEPLPREKKDMNVTIRQYIVRDSKQKVIAFLKANYTCEANCNHELFRNDTNNLNYVESHHLIPLAFQNNFKHSLDVFSNIISLCPSCHRKIHFGTKVDKMKLLSMFYKLRKEGLEKSKILISETELLEIYNIE